MSVAPDNANWQYRTDDYPYFKMVSWARFPWGLPRKYPGPWRDHYVPKQDDKYLHDWSRDVWRHKFARGEERIFSDYFDPRYRVRRPIEDWAVTGPVHGALLTGSRRYKVTQRWGRRQPYRYPYWWRRRYRRRYGAF